MLLLTQADARALPFRDACVQCVVTSPPYFGLRDYGTARWEGGDPACDHAPEKRGGRFATPVSAKQASNIGSGTISSRECPCGAHRLDQQIGLEPTIDAYVSTLVAVFHEVRRVLKPDGVCWLNLGDSYAGSGPSGASYQSETTKRRANLASDGNFRISKTLEMRGLSYAEKKPIPPTGLKSKDLCMIPARVALALQADGWWLRSEIVWSKPNPMPESVTDRPTKAHEMVYLLAKSERYYFDADAVREPVSPNWTYGGGTAMPLMGEHRIHGITKTARRVYDTPKGANLRSVWHLATQPYPGAHFATMPERLVERCILAGSRAGDVVLDPFMGSGTVARVALRLARKAIGCDLNPAYLDLADDRTTVTYGLPLGL